MILPGYSVATLKGFTGREIGISDWTTVDQRRIDEFADCTGDRPWIHVTRRRAAIRMDHTRIHGHRIRYGVRTGSPERVPLPMLNGVGANIELAGPFIDALTGSAIAIFDVPEVGGSPTPRWPNRPSNVARLAEGLLGHLGYAHADVLAVSWGGAIARQFAFQHPLRCRRLVLAAMAAGALMVPGNPLVVMKMATPKRYLDQAHAHRVAGGVYGGAFRRDPELAARTFRHVRFSSRSGYYLQLAAVFGWTSLPWLFLLRQPTLIMAGTDDPLVPLINARIMQWFIPAARFAILDCGHLFLVTLPDESARIVGSFLAEPLEHVRRTRRRGFLSRRSLPRGIS